MDRGKQLELYQEFLVKCTPNAKSVRNYSDFKRINECLEILFQEKQGLSILDFDDPSELERVIEKLNEQKQFVDYDKRGRKQYSNALMHYLRFLYAKNLFSNTSNELREKRDSNISLQQIFYGAPGTGKSFTIKEQTEGEDVIRTTFHPDSDYSTFVGSYKPTTREVPMRDVTGKVIVENGDPVTENRIIYEFVSQAFLQAYVGAWQKYAQATDGKSQKQYLVIEEINRGNCAQIFGDLFQLLDRNEQGFSEYPIKADSDLKKHLKKLLKGLTIENADAINALYKGEDVVGKVLNGEELLLPSNLYIWATMNTSDQSLFPIDSAFKRRWDWSYVPIANAELNWVIEVKGKKYKWWDFLKKINALIGEKTHSEDKKLGYFFCKTSDGIITADTFVSKVIFYLWNDVFKDFEFDSDIFNDTEKDSNGNTLKLTFDKFYRAEANNKPTVREDKVDLFLTNLEVHFDVGDEEDEDDENEDESEEGGDDNYKEALREIHFPDGVVISSQNQTQFNAFLEALQKIGIDKVFSVDDQLKYQRRNCPILSREKYPEIENDSKYSYHQIGDYYIVKGAKHYTYLRILEDLSELLNLNLKVVSTRPE